MASDQDNVSQRFWRIVSANLHYWHTYVGQHLDDQAALERHHTRVVDGILSWALALA